MASSPVLRKTAVAMVLLFAVQLLAAAAPADWRVLPAARRLLQECTGDPTSSGGCTVNTAVGSGAGSGDFGSRSGTIRASGQGHSGSVSGTVGGGVVCVDGNCHNIPA